MYELIQLIDDLPLSVKFLILDQCLLEHVVMSNMRYPIVDFYNMAPSCKFRYSLQQSSTCPRTTVFLKK